MGPKLHFFPYSLKLCKYIWPSCINFEVFYFPCRRYKCCHCIVFNGHIAVAKQKNTFSNRNEPPFVLFVSIPQNTYQPNEPYSIPETWLALREPPHKNKVSPIRSTPF